MPAEPKKITQNIYARLNQYLEQIEIMDHEYEKQEQNYINKLLRLSGEKFLPGTILEMESQLIKDAAVIRELRLDAQRLALQNGEKVAEWYAKRNWEKIKNE